MLFPTFNFALFFLVAFTLGWALRGRHLAHKIVLTAASYFFYGYWDWRFTFLLLASSLINYTAGRFIEAASTPAIRKAAVGLAVAADLTVLGFFKYYGFFITSLDTLLRWLNIERDLPFLEIILPVGISFFTFQGISYIADVYRGQVSGRQPLINVLFYLSFFPHLVAGPIVRAAYFLPQLEKKPDPRNILSGMGFLLILMGVFKKAILANYLAVEMVDGVFFDPSAYHPIDLILGLYGYSIQLYCDFSAYTDIAIGVAALFGYRFTRNFNQPWRSASLAEFWQRWHISLSTWLRDYLFIPLGGSRHGRAKTIRNILITMFLGGVWHGAGWTYVLWSIYHSVALAMERLIVPTKSGGPRPWWRRALGICLVFNLFAASWILFRSASLDVSWQFLTALGRWEGEIKFLKPFILTFLAVGFGVHFLPSKTFERIEAGFARLPITVQGLVFGLALVIIEAFGPEGLAPFIYFQF